MSSSPSISYKISGSPTDPAAIHLMEKLIQVGDRPEAHILCDCSKMIRQLGKWLEQYYTPHQIERSGLSWYQSPTQIQLYHKAKIQFTITFYK